MINFYCDKSYKFIFFNTVLQICFLFILYYKLNSNSVDLVIYFSFLWFITFLFYENYFYNLIFLKFFKFLEDEVDKKKFINQIIQYLLIISFIIFIINFFLILIKNIFFLKLYSNVINFKIISLFLSTFFILSSCFLLTISQNKLKIYLSMFITYSILYLIILSPNYNYQNENFLYFGLVYIIPFVLLIDSSYIQSIRFKFDDRILYFYKKLFIGFIISNSINIIFFLTIILLYVFNIGFFDLVIIFNIILLLNITFIQQKCDDCFDYLFNNSSTISISDSVKFQNKSLKKNILTALFVIIATYSIYFLFSNLFKLNNNFIFLNKINFLIMLLIIIPLSLNRIFLTFIFYREEVSSKEPVLISFFTMALSLLIIFFLIYFKHINLIPISLLLLALINSILFTFLIYKKKYHYF